MHITAQEEYGLRCLLRVAGHASEEPMRTQEVAEAEGISLEYAAKLMRILKQGGLVISTRGAAGGYLLARPAGEITVWDALEVLGGPLYSEGFCDQHSGSQHDCTNHNAGCSLKTLWNSINAILRAALSAIPLVELSGDERSKWAWLVRSSDAAAEAARDQVGARVASPRAEA
ncbi:MAG: Rrf2 family transcriptional regulator [Deltaproteobacteria bacterium]|nr:Rrf2 family transcriptional regulator [Deltaproteobacteria bacterium]